VRAAYTAYDAPRALQLLDARYETEAGIDRLLVLLDYGMVLHASGRWAESREVLAKADALSQQLDVTSVTEEAGALLANETLRTYRGEDFEKLMITVLQALNYAQLGDDEGALVEVRRCNERLEKMVAQNKPYEQLAIARYLGGMLYEDQHDPDAAVIDYLKARAPGALAEPALRLAKQTDRGRPHHPARGRRRGGAAESPGGAAVLRRAGTGRAILPRWHEGHGWSLARARINPRPFVCARGDPSRILT
jgi:uncharacterized protein